jgi:HlyD family secretion protein
MTLPANRSRPALRNRLTAPLWLLVLTLLTLAGCGDGEDGHMVGTLERDRIELVVESNEPILEIRVADGERVAEGDVVLVQDPTRHAARLAQQVALRDQAAGRLAELVRGPRPELIEEARARLAGSEASRVNARKQYERAQIIFDQGVGQESAVDSTRAAWEEAVAREAADREALGRLLAGTTLEELDQAEAALAAAEAAVAQATLDLERTTVRATVPGVLDKVWFRVGERPRPGEMVAVLLDERRSYARIYVPESDRARIRPGETLKVRLDGVDETFDGTVRWVSSDASFTPYFALTEHDRSRLSYLAEVDVPDAADLPSGLPLEAWLE